MANKALAPQKKVEGSENPFYKMTQTLNLFREIPKLGDKTTEQTINSLLNNAWEECKASKEKKQLFYILFFAIGDITNREHNIFKKAKIKNPDDGGFSQRKSFQYALKWLHNKDKKLFYKFLPLIGEYYNLGASTMLYTIRTDRYKGTVKEIFQIPNIDVDALTDYITVVLKDPRTTDNEKALWAKWLWTIPNGKTRQRKMVVTEIGAKKYKDYKVGDTVTKYTSKQTVTLSKDTWVHSCIKMLSDKMNWTIVKHKSNIQYVGYSKFRTTYLANTEAVLFSTKKILEWDKTQIMEWINQLPSGARWRVQCRVVDKEGSKLVANKKWIAKGGVNIGEVYLEWMNIKDKAQDELRQLSKTDKEKLKKEDPNKLKQMEKAAKVNVGATTFLDVMANCFKGGTKKEIDTVAQSLLDKMDLKVPIMVCVDTSGSMGSSAITHNGVHFNAIQLARLATTLFLLKNPKEELQDMCIRFDNDAKILASGQYSSMRGSNRYLNTSLQTIKWLVDPKKPFSDNLANITSLLPDEGGATNFNLISNRLKEWVDAAPNTADKAIRIEMINEYPVFLLISDGDLNGRGNPASTMMEFQKNMKQWFGWEGLVVVWDTKVSGYGSNNDTNKFEGLDNVMYFGGTNIAIVNQIFTNISDMEIIDVYTPLKSLFESNRYIPVKAIVK